MPEAAEFAAGLHLHVVEILRRQVAGMRVERGEHAVDRGLDQLLRFHLFDILGADALEDVAEQVKLFIDR